MKRKVKKAKSGLKSRIPKSMKNPKRGIILNRKKQTVPTVKKTGVTGTTSDDKRAAKVMQNTFKSNAKKNKMKTKKQLALAALKKAPLGSNKRRKLYNILGYKQDNTTTGYKKAKSSVKKTGVKTGVTPKSKVSVTKKAKQATKQVKKATTARSKGKAALASGNRAKALRMKKKEVRQTKRAIKKTKRVAKKTKRVAKRAVRRSKRK